MYKMTAKEISVRLRKYLEQSKDDILPLISELQVCAINNSDDELKCERVEHSVKVWQKSVLELLTAAFGDEDVHLERFADTMSKRSVLELDNPQRFLRRELNDGISYIEALIPCLDFVNMTGNKTPATVAEKTPKLFISHSSQDSSFVEALVDLLEYLGFDESTLFCSSVAGYGIRLGLNIFEQLRDQFDKHLLFVIFIHSPHYYNSCVSLNEMGAAWILKNNYYSFLTKGTSFSQLKGVVTSQDIAVKVDAKDAKLRLNELRETLCTSFGLQLKNDSRWETKRDEFLRIVND